MRNFLVIAAIIAAALGTWGPKWLEEWNAQRSEEAQIYLAEGKSFGQSASLQQCMDKALFALNSCSGNACTINQGLFLKACLQQQTGPTDSFCQGIPPFRNKPLEKDKEWARYFCRDKEIAHEGCRFLLQRQQYFCSGGVAADADETLAE